MDKQKYEEMYKALYDMQRECRICYPHENNQDFALTVAKHIRAYKEKFNLSDDTDLFLTFNCHG